MEVASLIRRGLGLMLLSALLRLLAMCLSGRFDEPPQPTVTYEEAMEAQRTLTSFVDRMEREHPEEWRRAVRQAMSKYEQPANACGSSSPSEGKADQKRCAGGIR